MLVVPSNVLFTLTRIVILTLSPGAIGPGTVVVTIFGVAGLFTDQLGSRKDNSVGK